MSVDSCLWTVIHVGEAIVFRMWWLLPTAALAGLGEVIGWAGRLWSSQSPGRLDPFLMQWVWFSQIQIPMGTLTCFSRICSTIIAPTPLLAVNFVVLGILIGYLGPQYSRLSPGWCWCCLMYAR